MWLTSYKYNNNRICAVPLLWNTLDIESHLKKGIKIGYGLIMKQALFSIYKKSFKCDSQL